MISEALAGKTVLVTGATGFLGKGLVEKILRSCPDVAEVRLLIRPLPGRSAQERLETRVLGAEAFDRLKEELGDAFADRAAKLSAVEADLEATDLGGAMADGLSGLDLVVHCAASVEFDIPLDDAISINVGGTVGLLKALKNVGPLPPMVHVSTAYVAGLRRGIVLEMEPGKPGKSVTLDWRDEAEAADAVRRRVEEESRSPERAALFRDRAQGELGPSGQVSVARRAEEFRKRWVDQTLVDRGRSRAQSLGWPDVYTLTKMLAERHLLSETRGSRLAIVRPTIIEAALREPYPGWIEGLKVSEPIILAYAQGQLDEFTGSPNTILDVIPVDFVVNTILGAAADVLTADDAKPEPHFYAIGTGNRNPLKYHEAFDGMADYFEAHPLLDGDGRPIRPGQWSYPGQKRLERRLSMAKRIVEAGEKWINRAPGVGPVPALLGRLVRFEGEVEQAAKLARMYGPYTELDCVFDDTNTAQLFARLPAEDRETFLFDVAEYDSNDYWQHVHLPAVSKTFGRWFSGRSGERSSIPALPGGDGQSNVLAVFDIEGTIVDATIVHYYAWLRVRDMGKVQKPLWLAQFAARVPGYLAMDHRSRTDFNRHFYRNYRGMAVTDVKRRAREAFGAVTVPRLYPDAIRRIREHKARGHRVLLITGAADFLVEPLRVLVDDVIAAGLEETRGLFTGEMTDTPLTGEARSSMVAAYARDHGLNLARSWAYADSLADLPMLEAVGHPVAVNPDHRLARTARRRRWPVVSWETEPGGAGLGQPWGAEAETVRAR